MRKRANKLLRDPYGIGQNNAIGQALARRDERIDQFDSIRTAYEERIAQKEMKLDGMDSDSDAYKKAAAEIAKMKSELLAAESAAQKLSGAGGAVGAVFANVGESVGRVISQFGRQMFQKAIQEAKRFVQEYDAAMTEIQMVTGKTDAEISSLGSSLIQTAIDMKVSVSDVTTAATDLYRQGIDDEEVSVRMEDVLKFAKVANIKADEASKIITTAMSNGLVEDSGEAMDALVALGDAAATSAEEIAKGMQKSAASAKQAGVSYEELVTMLTIITSKTQLGGNQAGTALQTLMYRLYRVNEGEDFYDENGNRIAANDASKALKELGVSIYDENGQPRGAFDIMVDVANNWEDASNISQERVLNALGAGRQRSNIATLIQGLAEDGGALMEKYMALASGSEGVTDEKYLAYLDSLNAALTTVQSSFDQLVASFELGGKATDILDFFSEFIQGLAAAEEASGALSATVIVLTGAMIALTAVTSALSIAKGNWVSGVAGLAGLAGIAALGGISWYGNNVKRNTAPTIDEISERTKEDIVYQKTTEQTIDDTRTLYEKYVAGAATELEIDQLQANLDSLTEQFGLATVDLSKVGTNAETVANTLASANKMLQSEFSQQLKSNIAEAKAAAAEEIIPNVKSVQQLQAYFNVAMGAVLNDGSSYEYFSGQVAGSKDVADVKRYKD